MRSGAGVCLSLRAGVLVKLDYSAGKMWYWCWGLLKSGNGAGVC